MKRFLSYMSVFYKELSKNTIFCGWNVVSILLCCAVFTLFKGYGDAVESDFLNVSLAMNTLDPIKVESLVVNVTPLVFIQ